MLLEITRRQLLARTARAQREGRLPSLVAGVVREGGLAWSSGHGEVEAPYDDVQYRLGSITKTITALAVLRLRDAGRLTLSDPIELHVPGTPFGERTVGQLLAHGAGLRAEAPTPWWERTPGLSWPELSARLSAVDVPHEPGRRFHYSNLGYAVLGELLARAHGRPWSGVVETEVLRPLEMLRTSARPSGRAARGFAVHPHADVLLPEPEHDAVALAPAGQLWATLADLARLGAFLISDGTALLATGTLEEMAVPSGIDSSSPGWSAYGLGLQVMRHDGRTITGHGGSMPGFLASVMVDREQDLGSVVLCNATSGLDPALVGDLHAVVRIAEPVLARPWRASRDVEPAVLALVGPWYWGPYPYALRLEAGELHLAGTGSPGRRSRFRRQGDGSWLGLDGYHAGETMRVVGDPAAPTALDLGSFVFTRTPYDPAGPVPGGVDPGGWGAA